mgnify:FL=1
MKDNSPNKYTALWQSLCQNIVLAVQSGGDEFPLSQDDLEQGGGDRQSYTFRLEFVDGMMPRRSGTAVGRDLQKILHHSSEFQRAAKGKTVIIRLDSDFKLIIKVE